jgi:hypothetical protein
VEGSDLCLPQRETGVMLSYVMLNILEYKAIGNKTFLTNI